MIPSVKIMFISDTYFLHKLLVLEAKLNNKWGR